MDLTALHWDGIVNPPVVLPDEPDFRTLLYALRQGECSTCIYDRRRNMLARPVSEYDTLAAWEGAISRGKSDTTAFDEITYSLLRAMPYAGRVASVSYVQRLRTYPQAISNHLLQMGICKGGYPHVFETDRPIKVGSVPNRSEASSIHAETAYRAEMDGTLAGQVFAYRSEIRSQYMAFTARAISSMHLVSTGESHIVDGDESGAFDTPTRSDVEVLSAIMPTQCSFGAWAREFYGRQQVRLYTVHGISGPVTTQEGFSQGCSFAATGYGVVGSVRNQAVLSYLMRGADPVISAHELVYSDDQRWMADSEVGIVQVTSLTHQVAGSDCAINNLTKMAYTSLRLLGDGNIQRMGNTITVAGRATRAGMAVPTVVGIPIQPGTCSPLLLSKVTKHSRRLRSFVKRYQPTWVLLIRSVYAYIVSVVDFVASGAYLPDRATGPVQTSVASIFRTALALPDDTPLSALTLPVRMFGWGCPEVSIKAELTFIMGYLQAHDCRSSLTRHFMRHQREHPLPLCDDDASVARNVLPQYSLFSTGEHLSGYNDRLPQLAPQLAKEDKLVIVTDAGLPRIDRGDTTDKVGGMGIVITDGVCMQLVAYRVPAVLANSTALEWLCRLPTIWVYRNFRGQIAPVCDNSSPQLNDYQAHLKVNPWCDRMAKLVLQLAIMTALIEFWMQAQHDSGLSSWIAGLQKRADNLATWAQASMGAPNFPLGTWVGLLEDPPMFFATRHSVVFK